MCCYYQVFDTHLACCSWSFINMVWFNNRAFKWQIWLLSYFSYICCIILFMESYYCFCNIPSLTSAIKLTYSTLTQDVINLIIMAIVQHIMCFFVQILNGWNNSWSICVMIEVSSLLRNDLFIYLFFYSWVLHHVILINNTKYKIHTKNDVQPTLALWKTSNNMTLNYHAWYKFSPIIH